MPESSPTFFSAATFHEASDMPARIITSIAMYYDLEDPVAFARDVAECLDPDGVWHFEQSYMPSMLRSTAYDTVCHEHIEYYSLATIRQILAKADLEARRRSLQPGQRRKLRRHRGSSRLEDRAEPCPDRLVRRAGAAHGARHARTRSAVRGARLPPSRPT